MNYDLVDMLIHVLNTRKVEIMFKGFSGGRKRAYPILEMFLKWFIYALMSEGDDVSSSKKTGPPH